MVMFYPAEGCRCGHCHAAPPAGAYPEGPDYEPEDGPLHLGFTLRWPRWGLRLLRRGLRGRQGQGPLQGSCPGRRPAPRVRLRLRALPYHRCGTRGLASAGVQGERSSVSTMMAHPSGWGNWMTGGCSGPLSTWPALAS